MERVTPEMVPMSPSAWIHQRIEKTVWNLFSLGRAWTRRLGAWGTWVLALCACAVLAGWVLHVQALRAQALALRLATQTQANLLASAQLLSKTDGARHADGRVALQDFDGYLLPHEDIPTVVQDVLRLAEDEGLSMKHGEYRRQVDTVGGFMRYRMNLPVEGAAPAIHRFIQSALLSHKTLALDGVQFKRDRIESGEMEARIQWVVLTRLPVGGAALSPKAAMGAAP